MTSESFRRARRACHDIALMMVILTSSTVIPAAILEAGDDLSSGDARADSVVLDAEAHKQMLIEVADVIREHYADVDVAQAIAKELSAPAADGKRDRPIDPDDFIVEVMRVIRSHVADRHFDLTRVDLDKSPPPSPTYRERSAHGLRETRVLGDSTIVLVFDALPGDDGSMGSVREALAELPDAEALVIDLRDNNGGSGDMVVLICSHLLEPERLLYTFSGRSGGLPGEVRTSAPKRRFGEDLPVYVLTSGSTLSAAEALAFILQDHDRAVVVGQRTPGMANPSRTFRIDDRFELTVPFLLMRYGKSGATFAGIGVTPDIEVPADSALDVALEQIAARRRVH